MMDGDRGVRRRATSLAVIAALVAGVSGCPRPAPSTTPETVPPRPGRAEPAEEPAHHCQAWTPPALYRHHPGEGDEVRRERIELTPADEAGLAYDQGCYLAALERAQVVLDAPRSPADEMSAHTIRILALMAMGDRGFVRPGRVDASAIESSGRPGLSIRDIESAWGAIGRLDWRALEGELPRGLQGIDMALAYIGLLAIDCGAPDMIWTPSMREDRVTQMASLLGAIDRSGFSESDGLELDLLLNRMACRVDDAAGAAESLITLRLDQGDRIGAAEAYLETLQLRAFETGRPDDMVLPHGADELARGVAREEALAAGSRATEAAALLEELRALRDETAARWVAAEATWTAAIVELRLRRDPEAAVVEARRAAETAEAARRFRIRDAAWAVEAFALAELGRVQEATARMASLVRSFEARGALGGARHLFDLVAERALLASSAGEPQASLAWADLGAQLVPLLSVEEALRARNLRAGALQSMHRLEEALEIFTGSEALVRERRAELDPRLFEQMLGGQRMYSQMLRARLGRVRPEDMDAASFDPSGRLPRAIREGDAEVLRRALEMDTLFPSQLGALMGAGFCGALASRAPRVASEARELSRQRAMARQRLDEASTRVDTSAEERMAILSQLQRTMYESDSRIGVAAMQVSVCAAVTGEAQYLELADEISALRPSLDGHQLYRDVARRVVAGDFDGAARRLEAAAGDTLSNAEIGASTAVSAFEGAAAHYEMAAAVRLRSPSPDVDAVVQDLERGRAQALRALRATRGGDQRPTTELAELEAAMAQKAGRARQLSQLAARASRDDVEVLERAIRETTDELRRLDGRRAAEVRRLRDQDPRAFRAAALADPPTLSELQARLRQDEALLYVKVDPEQAWTILIDGSSARVFEVDARAEDGLPALALGISRLQHLVDRRSQLVRGIVLVHADERTRRREADRVEQELERVRADLHRRLLAPMLAHLPEGRRVIVVPDARTGSLPFAALGTGADAWYRRNPIRYLSGAHQLVPPQERRPELRPAFVLGDPELGDEGDATSRGGASDSLLASAVSWQRLPGARQEARAIARLLGTRAVVGPEASEQRARRALGSARLVHFATHGLANPIRPDFSALVFSLPRDGAADDGILHAYEIEQLDLSAELVVLSACETARGQIRGAEGVLAIDRAFLVAGAGAVVSSLWPVADDATAILMTRFYQRLREGDGADVALARAMAAVEEDPRFRAPFFWAPFRVVGSGLR